MKFRVKDEILLKKEVCRGCVTLRRVLVSIEFPK